MRANPSLAWGYSGSVLFLVHAPMQPSPADWDEFRDDVWTHTDVQGIVVITNADTRLTPLQRAEIHVWHQRRKVRAAVITESTIIHGIVAVMHWFGVTMQTFPPKKLEDALDFAGVPASDRHAALALVARLEAAVIRLAPASTG